MPFLANVGVSDHPDRNMWSWFPSGPFDRKCQGAPTGRSVRLAIMPF